MGTQQRVNVYANDEGRKVVVARVVYNQDLDYWDGQNMGNGGLAMHKGITKLKNGRYVIIIGSMWTGVKDYGYVVPAAVALQEILKAGRNELLETEKYKDLKMIYNATVAEER